MPWQRFAGSKDEVIALGNAVLEGLTPEERKGAMVRLIEINEVVIGELR